MGNSILLIFFLIPLFLLATSFTRIFIILSFLKRGLGDIGLPSGQILFGLALLFSIIVMREPLNEIYTRSFIPYTEGKKSVSDVLKESEVPLRVFMAEQVSTSDLDFVKKYSHVKAEETQAPFTVLLGAFTLSELKKGLLMGFLLWIPFLIVDLVVSTFIAAVGIHSLSTALIALPLKILLFLAVDGWKLIFGSIAESYWVR
jgi:flagellar biosynthetic protein FliP